jgi:hypothetical protein
MKRVALLLAFAAIASVNAQVAPGQTDTFTSTTQNWNGASPTWMSGGGPGGAGDGYLRLTSSGGAGPGSKMTGYNSLQWSGNFIGAGVNAISVDFNNAGNTALEMRLVFFDSALSTQWVSNASAVLNAGSGWQHFTFSLGSAAFTQTEGATSYTDTLTNANRMMFRHDPGAPSNGGTAVVATLGIDNVHAVPEPATLAVLGLGLLAALKRRR